MEQKIYHELLSSNVMKYISWWHLMTCHDMSWCGQSDSERKRVDLKVRAHLENGQEWFPTYNIIIFLSTLGWQIINLITQSQPVLYCRWCAYWNVDSCNSYSDCYKITDDIPHTKIIVMNDLVPFSLHAAIIPSFYYFWFILWKIYSSRTLAWLHTALSADLWEDNK